MLRKMRRDRIRKDVGNRNLKTSWAIHQRERYGKLYHYICKPKQVK